MRVDTCVDVDVFVEVYTMYMYMTVYTMYECVAYDCMRVWAHECMGV